MPLPYAIIIPARYKSSRFPGKPLAEIAGTPMIIRVWEQCCKAVPAESVFVATDDRRIAQVCESHGARVVMTPEDCLTGTDRVYAASLQIDAELYINVQGDEPVIDPENIRIMIQTGQKNPQSICNAMGRITTEEEYRSPAIPKVVARPDGRLMYMSRAAIPTNKDLEMEEAWKQVCIYCFPKELLAAFAESKGKTAIEKIEDIEILRFLELGYEVQMTKVSGTSIAVDFPQDVDKVEQYLSERS